MRIINFYLLFNLILFLGGCPGQLVWEDPPVDRPYYPESLAQTDDNKLLVISFNRDRRYGGGSLISLNLQGLTPDKLSPKVFTSGKDLIESVALIPSFSMAPTFDADGNLLLLSRSKSKLLALNRTGSTWGCNDVESVNNVANCMSNSLIELLLRGTPYFLRKINDNNQESKFLIGYLREPKSEIVDETNDTPLKDVGEIQFLTRPKIAGQNSSSKNYFVDGMLNRSSNDSGAKKIKRTTNLGGMQILANKWVLLAATAPIKGKSDKESFLVWFEKEALGKDNLDASSFNFAESFKDHSIKAIETIEDENIFHIYVATSNPARLFKIDLEVDGENLQAVYQKQVLLCEEPIDIKASWSKKTLLVACSLNNEIVAYDADTLDLAGKDSSSGKPFGKGPVSILFDKITPSRAYVAYSTDGSIGVFNVTDAGSNRLTPLGSIFESALANHPGGR